MVHFGYFGFRHGPIDRFGAKRSAALKPKCFLPTQYLLVAEMLYFFCLHKNNKNFAKRPIVGKKLILPPAFFLGAVMHWLLFSRL